MEVCRHNSYNVCIISFGNYKNHEQCNDVVTRNKLIIEGFLSLYTCVLHFTTCAINVLIKSVIKFQITKLFGDDYQVIT